MLYQAVAPGLDLKDIFTDDCINASKSAQSLKDRALRFIEYHLKENRKLLDRCEKRLLEAKIFVRIFLTAQKLCKKNCELSHSYTKSRPINAHHLSV